MSQLFEKLKLLGEGTSMILYPTYPLKQEPLGLEAWIMQMSKFLLRGNKN